MAEEGGRSISPGGLIPRPRIWTFSISSGPFFQIALPNNPPLDYKGGREIWKISAIESTASAVLSMLESLGVAVTRYTEKETLEQTRERRKLLGL